MRVLILEDEPYMAEAIRDGLRLAAIAADIAADGEAALALLRVHAYDVAVLDRDVPGPTGDEIAERIVASGSGMPILMLTAADRLDDKASGFELGADDYLTKPFSPPELVLRVGAILRRVGAQPVANGDIITVGAMKIDRAAMTVDVDDNRLDLTPTEFKLLMTLVDRRGRVQGRAHLLETVWEAAPDIQTRTVDMHIQRLRTKMGPAGDMIETVRGFGYRLRGAQGRAH